MRSRNDCPGSCVTSITRLVREQPRAAGDARAVAARLADHGRRLAGDRGLVDGADALDDLAVGGDQLARGHDDDVAAAAAPAPGTSSTPPLGSRRWATVVVRVARSALACALPRPSAMASAKLAKSTVSQSQKAIDAGEPERLLAGVAANGVDDEDRRDDDAADLDDEDHGVAERACRGSSLRNESRDRAARRSRA